MSFLNIALEIFSLLSVTIAILTLMTVLMKKMSKWTKSKQQWVAGFFFGCAILMAHFTQMVFVDRLIVFGRVPLIFLAATFFGYRGVLICIVISELSSVQTFGTSQIGNIVLYIMFAAVGLYYKRRCTLANQKPKLSTLIATSIVFAIISAVYVLNLIIAHPSVYQTVNDPYSQLVIGLLTYPLMTLIVGGFILIDQERKDQFDTLIYSERKVRAILDLSLGYTGLLSVDGKILDANKTALSLINADLKDVEGKYIWETAWSKNSVETQAFFRQAIENVKQGKTIQTELTFVDFLGAVKFIDFSIVPIFNEVGEVIFLIPEGRDITERKKMERELLNLNSELEYKVQERTSQLSDLNLNLKLEIDHRKKTEEALIRSKEIAEAATESKSQFLANMSHEIRTPLNAIIGFNYLLKKTDLNARQKEYVEKSILSSNSLLTLINDILDYSKIEAQKLFLEAINFDLYEAIRDVVDIVSLKVEERGLKLKIFIQPEVPEYVIGDPHRLKQVLLNLINNAIKFTDAGYVQLKVDVNDMLNDNVILNFEVSDTGIGIDSMTLKSLFSSFNQGDMSTTRKYGGTGLGLAISKNLVELMGGAMGCHSNPGKGSKFFFTLPLPIGTSVFNKSSEYHQNQLNIVFLQGSKHRDSTISGILKEFGFNVLEMNFSDLETVGFERYSYDLVIINAINMEQLPEEIIPNIQHCFGKKIPITIVTDTVKNEHNGFNKSIEVDKVIQYPVGQSQLYNTIIEMAWGKQVTGIEQFEKGSYTSGAISGSRILLVEDNEVNQLVAKSILEEEHVQIDMASNGELAVALARDGNYDLILMDIQMPVMDGYKACEIIRKVYSKEELPIIAMTADAGRGVEEEIYKAGMNAYITKPINPYLLFKTIESHLVEKSSNPIEIRDSEGTTKINESKQLPISIEGIDLDEVLHRFGGNETVLRTIFGKFIETQSPNLNAIREAIDEGELERAVYIAHTLKGTAANLSAPALYVLSKSLQDAIENADSYSKVTQILNVTESELKKVLESISKAL